jgi:ribosomal protein S18 acetylase RimI-like enzyme
MARTLAIRELAIGDLSAAIGVVARGMRDNPLHIAAFGEDATVRTKHLQRMFKIALPAVLRKGTILGAFDGPALLGIAGMVPPGRCQPSAGAKLAMLPRLIPAVGIVVFGRLARWLAVWSKHDLREPHWHVGPVAVDAHLQGQGLGRALMHECCARLDRAGDIGYLETDKSQNVEFYKKFGFETIGEATVLGTPNWFMRRR